MSPTNEPLAVAPKRQRGRNRVDAILEAASKLFYEHPFDLVTMTEVAALSKTATGSLYRFFPTKEALAAAIIERYGERLMLGLDELIEMAPLSARAAAEALLELARHLRQDRSVVLSLIEAGVARRVGKQALRYAVIERLRCLLSLMGMKPGQTVGPATLLFHLLRTIFDLRQEEDNLHVMLDREACEVIRLYLESRLAC